jgi:hypothetical protein
MRSFQRIAAAAIAVGMVSLFPLAGVSYTAESGEILLAQDKSGDRDRDRARERRTDNWDERRDRWRWRNWCRYDPDCRYRYRSRGPSFGLYFGLPLYNDGSRDGFRRNYRSNSSAHVRWCLDRYRSYNPRTDTFLSYSGVRRYCNSPYN